MASEVLKLWKPITKYKDNMAKLKNENKMPTPELSSQERQAIYSASPFFKKKKEEAITFLEKHPIPKEFIKQRNR